MPEHSRIVLGVITGVHGIQGEVKLKSFTADPEAIASYGPLDASNGTVLQIKTLKAHKDFFPCPHRRCNRSQHGRDPQRA